MSALAYHAGGYVPPEQASLPLSSIALRYGVVVFEGVRLYEQAGGGLRPWLLEPHLERLAHSCRTCHLDVPDLGAVAGVLDRLVERNGCDGDAYARVVVSAGNPGDLFAEAEPVLTVTVAPMGRKRWLDAPEGMRLQVSRWQRPPAGVLPPGAKTIAAYAGARIALREARAAGFDSCLLTTATGLVSEAPTATLFLVERGRLVTPRLDDGVLPGVTRAWLLALAADLGLDAACEPVPPERLAAADEVFLCGTGIEVAPVGAVDGAPVGSWPHHPVTDAVAERLFAEARGADVATSVRWAPR